MATGRDSSYWATVVFKQYFFAVLFIKLDWSIEVNHFKIQDIMDSVRIFSFFLYKNIVKKSLINNY